MRRCTALAVLFLGPIGLCCGRGGVHRADPGEVVARSDPNALAKAERQSDDLRAADQDIAGGHPWRATVRLAPLLRDPSKRTPAAVLLAARAAAGWDGWAEVGKLLSAENWVDTAFGGEGRELLARSALEQDADTTALAQARAAVAHASTPRDRAVRLVYLARAYDRQNEPDSAAPAYAEAAKSLADVGDWLRLRAAGSEQDGGERTRAYNEIQLATAKARVPWTEAQALERFSDLAGAADKYEHLGATVQALRLRLMIATDEASRAAVQRQLLSYIQNHSGSGDAKQAVDVLDKAFNNLDPTDELVIARSAAASGPLPRAIVGFERALTVPNLVTPRDRMQYGLALSRAGRSRDAMAQLALIQGPLAGQAAYQRARLMSTGGQPAGTDARAALRQVVQSYPGDTIAASSALYLLADLSTDDRDDAQAASLLTQLYSKYPTAARAPDARFRAALVDYMAGRTKLAAARFDSVAQAYPRADDGVAGRYWAGRALAAAGNNAAARTRWDQIVTQQPTTYYAVLSARRLRSAPFKPAAAGSEAAALPDVDAAIARAQRLEQLGMDVEARLEWDALDSLAANNPSRLIATARALAAHGEPARASHLAARAALAGHNDAASYRLIYPVLDREELSHFATARGLDVALVAGLIRQESGFNPRAVSVAGARGLMQVLPAVGEEVAHGLRYPVWYPSLLFDPDVNLELGTAHLAEMAKQYGSLVETLAAYNAGGTRVTRWLASRGSPDPELFTERIPFTETRDYVRLVTRNSEMYKVLYGW